MNNSNTHTENAGYSGKLWFKALRAVFYPVRLALRCKRLLCKDPGEFFRRASVACVRVLVFLFFAEAVGMLLAGQFAGAFFFGVFFFIAAFYTANYDGE